MKPVITDLGNTALSLEPKEEPAPGAKEEIKDEKDEIKEEAVTPPETPAANGATEYQNEAAADSKDAGKEQGPEPSSNGTCEPMETEESAHATNGNDPSSVKTPEPASALAPGIENQPTQNPASPESQAVDLTPDALAVTAPLQLTSTAAAPPEEVAAPPQPPPGEPQPQQQHIYIQAIDPKTNLPIQVRR